MHLKTPGLHVEQRSKLMPEWLKWPKAFSNWRHQPMKVAGKTLETAQIIKDWILDEIDLEYEDTTRHEK